MEWVEVRGRSVDIAVEAAMQELEITSRDQVEVEVLQEPEKGFLGIGSKDAVVRVKPRPERKRRRRRRRGGGKGGDGKGGNGRQGDRNAGTGNGQAQSKGGQGRQNGGQRQGNDRRPRQGSQGARDKGQSRQSDRSKAPQPSGRERPSAGRKDGGDGARRSGSKKEAPAMAIEDQATVIKDFLGGLVDSFGLDGDVTVSVEDDVIVADVKGPQTEAMVGPRGSVIEAIHELSKTVLHRQTQSSARVRLDIAGYGQRRRQALSIYAGQLIDQVLDEGGEVMLEPMSAGDRKVIHDAVAAREGVRSFSEGEAPRRYVVIAATGTGDSGEEE